ncbi:MAG: hypothetical protein CVU46_13140 [Chloroflexi bacterium HGW-Chloroflexi-8]|nr:MAG: hypothetical protein CVU46_13140 [Chloroflexi bacterium HGW-Chloroflexi-8]
MATKRLWTILIIFIITGCQITQFTNTLTPEPVASATLFPTATTEKSEPTATITPLETPVVLPETDYFKLTTWKSFNQLGNYQKQTYNQPFNTLPISLTDVANPEVIRALTTAQLEFLKQNGFVILQSNDAQFSDIRDVVAKKNGQAFFLTTDTAYHALHVAFNDLLKATEQEALRPTMIKMIDSLYRQIEQYLQSNPDANLKRDLLLSRNYLAVAWKLFEPGKTFSVDVEDAIAAQLAQIAAMEGKAESALIPGLTDDYGSYRPVGHYAGVPELESYFQGMTWLGRVAFSFPNPSSSQIQPTRAPLLITLALREAQVDGVPAEEVWTQIYEITNFMIGPSDDPGPIELNKLMEQFYGPNVALKDLIDEDNWIKFLAATEQLPAPQINSTFQNTSLAMESERDWRLMGQRFTIDSLIFQQLISDKVEKRFFPTGLDLAAAYGSSTALTALEEIGETKYVHYTDQMEKMQSLVTSLSPNFWTERFYTGWQYAFLAQLANKNEAFPAFMSSSAWGYKDINSVLGSWTQLKHDTILYTKMPEGLGGGGPPVSPPTPTYVEPNPDVFYRLSYAANTLNEGLTIYLSDWEKRGWLDADTSGNINIHQTQNQLSRLGPYFQTYAEIAEKELNGQEITDSDYEVTQYCLELIDCMYPSTVHFEGMQEQDPIPLVAAVSGWDQEVLEAAIGNLNRIFVAVPLNGNLYIAQGGVYTYFEFKQPRSDRLTDEAWREKLVNDPPDAPFWYKNLVLPGGKTNDVLSFRIGDVYYLTKEGYTPPLNLRSQPSSNASVVETMGQDTYLEIIAGPQKQGDQTWWQIRNLNTNSEGWVLENRAWFERSY